MENNTRKVIISALIMIPIILGIWEFLMIMFIEQTPLALIGIIVLMAFVFYVGYRILKKLFWDDP